MRKFLNIGEKIFIVISLLFCTGGPIPVLFLAGSENTDSEPDFILNRLIFLGISLIALLLTLPIWKRSLYLLERDKSIFLLTLVAILSVLWSFAPEITLRRSIGLLGTTILGVFWGTRFSLRQQVYLLAYTFGLAIVLSFIFGIFLPKYGVMSYIHVGAWRGIYTHKNVLGKIMILSASLFWLLIVCEKSNQLFARAGCALSWLLILLSGSTAAFLNAAFLSLIILALKASNWHYRKAVSSISFLLSTCTFGYIWIIANLENFLGSFGKNATLTGRTDLWPVVLDMIQKQLWLGYGYSGFWLGLNSKAGEVWQAVNWDPPNSHNGFLDLWLELGLLGFLIFILGFLRVFRNGLKGLQINKTAEGLWPILFLIYTVISNIVESSLLGPNSFFWILYIGISFGLLKEMNKYRFDKQHQQDQESSPFHGQYS